MARVKDLTGRVFGRLTVVSQAEGRIDRCAAWECLCRCGNRHTVRSTHLTGGATVSCGCKRAEGDPKAIAVLRSYAPHIRKGKLGALQYLYRRYKRQAAKAGRRFKLSEEEFQTVVEAPCCYCGAPPLPFEPRTRHPLSVINANGVDRVDNAKGYEIGNVVPCCTLCNRMKHVLGLAVFLAQVERIAKHQKEKAQCQSMSLAA